MKYVRACMRVWCACACVCGGRAPCVRPEALVLLCNALTLLCPAERPGPSPPPATGFPRANGWLPAAVPELPGTPGLLHFTAAEAAALPPPAPRRAPSAAAEAEVEAEGGAGEEDFPDAALPPLSLQSQLMVAPAQAAPCGIWESRVCHSMGCTVHLPFHGTFTGAAADQI